MEAVAGSSRLLTALEELGRSPGSELNSPSGPGGSPKESAVRAFEKAMAGPDAANPGGPGSLAETQGAGKTRENLAPGPAESMDPAGRAGQAAPADRVEPSENGGGNTSRADSTRRPDEGIAVTPGDLYRAQFQIGMLQLHVQTVRQVSGSVKDTLESALKQTG